MAGNFAGVPKQILDLLLKETPGNSKDQIDRIDVDFKMNVDRFVTQKKELAAQYADLYFIRLMKLKRDLLKKAKELWASGSNSPKVSERILEAETGVRCILVGTLYKEMKLKPNILDELNRENPISEVETLTRNNLVGEDDYVVLEDESGRVTLDKVDAGSLVTGLIVAVLGCLNQSGSFEVEQTCFPGLPPQPPTPRFDEDAYLLLVSGLSFGDPNADPLAPSLLADYLTGTIGEDADHAEAASIVKVIVCGGCCHRDTGDSTVGSGRPGGGSDARARRGGGGAGMGETTTVAAAATAKLRERSSPVRELDVWLTRVCSAAPVDIMPGPDDPSNAFLPQQPFHRCLIPSAATYASLRAVPNPHETALSGPGGFQSMDEDKEEDGLIVLGTSGQNLTDVLRYSTLSGSPASILGQMLQWRHLAPTAPDTLPCFPSKDEDPFLITRCPHIFFAGNQQEFAAERICGEEGQTVLAVAVPRFSQGLEQKKIDKNQRAGVNLNTSLVFSLLAVQRVNLSLGGVAAMVNLRTLEAFPISFGTAHHSA